MDTSLMERLTGFLHPKLADEMEIRQLLHDVPEPERHEFGAQAQPRLNQLEQVFHPFGAFGEPARNEQGYPTVQFTSEEHVFQLAHAMTTLRLKRRLLSEILGAR